MSEGHGHVATENKKIALLVAVLAAVLALSEMGGKSAQTHALADHIDASNLWSFFQAKTIRQTTMRTAADAIDAQYKGNPQPMPEGVKKQLDTWRQTAQRYETEPETGEGRKELAARAKAKEASREKSLHFGAGRASWYPQNNATASTLASEQSMRIAKDSADISKEKIPTTALLSIAACCAIVNARLVLPIEGRAAITTKSCF